MNQFLRGAVAMACLVAALFFFRFWKLARDRLFAIFSLAFVVFSLNWTALALSNPPDESRHQLYLLRLLAFAIIAAGIIDKNRRAA